jgi:tetratricopeptide (TPR) repeat protein
MYTEARRLAPENPWLALEQAEAWLALGLGGRCLENMDTALAGFSGMAEEAWLLQVMGRCQAQTGRHAEAVTAFTAALAVNPASVDAMGYRAVSQHAMGDYEALIADSAAMFAPGGGVEATPDWELTVRGLRIEAMVFLGRPDEAVAEVAAVRGRFPGGDLGAINLQAWGLFLIGNLDEADRAIRPIRDHEDPAALTGYMKDTLGQIDLALGRLEAAESALLDAAWYDPAIATGWLPALTTQGFLPQTRGADDILLSLLDCIEERGALCSLGPLAVDPTARVPLPARPDPGPSAVPGPSETPPPADAPGFEPSPGGDVTEPPGVPPPAAAEEGTPGLGAAPRPVRPVAP